MSLAPTDGYGVAFTPLDYDSEAGWYVCDTAGRRDALGPALGRWCGPVDAVDLALLARASGAVLDVGCGPGRLVAELVRQGQHALGVDVAAAAVHLTTQAGGAAIRRSVFARLPGEGLWDAVLLADGNVGIGGDPAGLLRRCRALARPEGCVLVELAAPGTGCSTVPTRLERDGKTTPWFDWAHVGVDAVDGPAALAGLRVLDRWDAGDRWFASLVT